MLLNESAFAEWVPNKACAPGMQKCMRDYAAKYGAKNLNNTKAPTAAECLRELQEKVTSCNAAASTAVDKCDSKREVGEGTDSLGALQNLLGGLNGYTQAKNAGTGATDNCVNAGLASSTGYYALEKLRSKCDGEISTCKTSCTDANSFIAANKERVYQQCRKKAFDENRNSTNFPYNGVAEETFNSDWDGTNKALFDGQIQEMQAKITDNNAKCETGTAVTNRDKMSDFMTDMNNSVKSASQCQCRLGSSGQDCSNPVGPSECAANPNLAGCAQATLNCLSVNDNSPKCICFRNPNSNECKNIKQANNVKVNSTDASSFAGVGGTGGSTGAVGGVSGNTEVGAVNVGDLSGLGSDGEAIGANASGTATADGGSPFGTAAGGAGMGSGSGGGGADGAPATEANGEEESSSKKIGGLFNVAKSALGNLFKKGKDDKGTYNPVTGKYIDGANNSGLDSKKWRPRGMVRGLAGDIEIAGKFEDIWKVMNRQYKIQDQKDTFLFGGEKK